jgi:hypothetical protein
VELFQVRPHYFLQAFSSFDVSGRRRRRERNFFLNLTRELYQHGISLAIQNVGKHSLAIDMILLSGAKFGRAPSP